MRKHFILSCAVFCSMLCLGLSSPLAVGSGNAVAAPQALSYLEKKEAIRERIDLAFAPYMSEFEKAEAVGHLYTLIFETSSGQHFDKEALVTRVQFWKLRANQPNPPQNPEDIAAYTRLRASSLLLLSSGFGFTDRLPESLEQEAETLRQIALAQNRLSVLLPHIEFKRSQGAFAPALNVNYLQSLSALEEAYRTAPAELRQALHTDYSALIFDDSNDPLYGQTSLKLRHEYNSQPALLLTVGRDLSLRERHVADAQMLLQMLSMAGLWGFNEIQGTLEDEQTLKTAYANLHSFLSHRPSRERLLSNGVRGFSVNVNYRQSRRLFERGILTVGPEIQDIQAVVDLVFL